MITITSEWEGANKPFTIHRGTTNFFLAENYLLTGDRDLAYRLLYDALLDDVQLKLNPQSANYPKGAPAYLTIRLKDSDKNHLTYFVKRARNRLAQHISTFNILFSKSFTIQTFDIKFLDNKFLKDIVSFFTFNYIYFVETEGPADNNNEFIRLRNLDFIFNLCLIIDKTLEEAEKNHKGSIGSYKMSDRIIWLSDKNGWLSQPDLEDLWSSGNLDLNSSDPDVILPKLLSRKEKYKNAAVSKELHDLLIAYRLRNYGGHNIRQQSCITSNFDDLVQCLLNSLFIAVEAL